MMFVEWFTDCWFRYLQRWKEDSGAPGHCPLSSSSRSSRWYSGCIGLLTSSPYILSEAPHTLHAISSSSWLWHAGHQHHQEEENNGKYPSLPHLSKQITIRCLLKAMSSLRYALLRDWAQSTNFGALDSQNPFFFPPTCLFPNISCLISLRLFKIYLSALKGKGRPSPLLITYTSSSNHMYALSGFLRVAISFHRL